MDWLTDLIDWYLDRLTDRLIRLSIHSFIQSYYVVCCWCCRTSLHAAEALRRPVQHLLRLPSVKDQPTNPHDSHQLCHHFSLYSSDDAPRLHRPTCRCSIALTNYSPLSSLHLFSASLCRTVAIFSYLSYLFLQTFIRDLFTNGVCACNSFL